MIFLSLSIAIFFIFKWIPSVNKYYWTKHFPSEKPYFMSVYHKIIVTFLILILTILYFFEIEVSNIYLPIFTLFICNLYAIIHFDIRYMVLPNRFQIWGIFSTLILLIAIFIKNKNNNHIFFYIGLQWGVLLLLYLFTFVYNKVKKRESMGMGDFKLLIWLMPLTLKNFTDIFIFAFLSSFVIVIFNLLTKKWNKNQYIPFAPYLILGFFYSLL